MVIFVIYSCQLKSIMKKVIWSLTFALLSGTAAVEAAVTLPRLLSSGMVVQHDRPLTLWGTADPGEEVRVSAEKGITVTATADSDGRWLVRLPQLKPGKPHTITINDITLDNVIAGNVLLCSGQSNMELPVNRVTDMFADEIAAYRNSEIRHFIMPKEVEFHGPRTDVSQSGRWKTLDEDVMNFSALAYFTARELNARTGLPVGIINASWGGTPVEAWISEEKLAEFPRAVNIKRIYEDDGYRDRIKHLENENFSRWNAAMWAADPGLHGDVKWYSPDFDDSTWSVVDLIGGNDSWSNDGLNSVNGSHWFRKNVNLPASMTGQPGVLRLGCIVDADSVYVNGTFVGTTGYQYPPRIYNIPAGLLREGVNNVTVRVISQNGDPHFVAEKPYKIIVGNESVSLEGDWRYHAGTPMPVAPAMEFYCYKPTVLYNSMIAPAANYPVMGAVWYQGESNVDRRNEYGRLLKTMIADWRTTFGNDRMPFYIVELADFLHPDDKEGRAAWAEMRAVQAKIADETPGVVLVTNSDLGEWNDIHPLDKKTLGNRVVDKITENQNNN